MQWTVPYNTKQYIMVYKLHRKQPTTQDILAVENFGPDWPLLFTLQCTKFGQLIVRKKSSKFFIQMHFSGVKYAKNAYSTSPGP